MEPTKRIFISDIHMGYEDEKAGRHPYVWFKGNAPLLEKFLDMQLNALDVREVVVLGDLFDQWNIPVDSDPVTNFNLICEDHTNKPVISKLQDLASAGKLIYVPGNHDMAMNRDRIIPVKNAIRESFPGIDFRCDADLPLGKYDDGTLVAEHGNRYCLFNAPDTSTTPASFLPLGYFVTRCVAFQSAITGRGKTTPEIISSFLEDFKHNPLEFFKELFFGQLIEQFFSDICVDQEANLTLNSIFKLNGIPGYDVGTFTLDDIKGRFGSIYSNWEKSSQPVEANMALINERDTLCEAAQSVYFYTESAGSRNVVIFGHTHRRFMKKTPIADGVQSFGADPNACLNIYANSGTWVDSAGESGTYVETEEVQEKGEKHLYVRLKEYTETGDTIEDWGFVKL